MQFVYFIKSLKIESCSYTGHTNNLARRLKEHNSKTNELSTANYRPFEIISYIAVKDKKTAVNLERYFKTGSGRAFLKKHFPN